MKSQLLASQSGPNTNSRQLSEQQLRRHVRRIARKCGLALSKVPGPSEQHREVFEHVINHKLVSHVKPYHMPVIDSMVQGWVPGNLRDGLQHVKLDMLATKQCTFFMAVSVDLPGKGYTAIARVLGVTCTCVSVAIKHRCLIDTHEMQCEH